jgi:hypothetical protein
MRVYTFQFFMIVGTVKWRVLKLGELARQLSGSKLEGPWDDV